MAAYVREHEDARVGHNSHPSVLTRREGLAGHFLERCSQEESNLEALDTQVHAHTWAFGERPYGEECKADVANRHEDCDATSSRRLGCCALGHSESHSRRANVYTFPEVDSAPLPLVGLGKVNVDDPGPSVTSRFY